MTAAMKSIETSATLEVITPEYARMLLERNQSNRKVIRARVLEYADMMIRGEWVDRHPGTIAVGTSGYLIDGQHRLLAVIESGVTITAFVAWNIPDKAYLTIDSHAPKSMALRIREPRLYPQIAGRMIDLINHFGVKSLRVLLDGLNIKYAGNRASPLQVKAVIDRVRNGIDWYSEFPQQHQRGMSRISMRVAAIEFFYRDRQIATEFTQSLLCPVPQDINAALLRNWLISRGRAMNGFDAECYLKSVYAMKATFEGRTISRLQQTQWN